MPILSMSAGRVTAVWGQAYFLDQDGSLKPIRVGDDVPGGQQILTDQNGIVEIEPSVLSPKLLKLIQAASDVDHTLKSLDSIEPDLVPAAGVALGSDGSLQLGLRVDRVVEALTPVGFGYDLGRLVVDGSGQHTGFQPLVDLFPQNEPGTALVIPPGESTVPLFSVSVSEEGLPGGIPDSVGNASSLDTTNLTVATGQLDGAMINAPAGALLTLVAPSTTVLTATGQVISWVSDQHGGLLGKVGGDPSAPNAVTVELDQATGRYTVTLLQPLQHSAQGEDALLIDFGVRFGGTDPIDHGLLQVSVEDDAPVQGINHLVTAPDTNLMIVLDVSADMGGPSGITGLTRMQATVQAIDQLFDQYAHDGQVAVRLVTFANQASAQGHGWVSITQAKSLLATLSMAGVANYDAALSVAQEAFLVDAGRLHHAQNVSYFFAGAQRSLPGSPIALSGIDASEEAAWARFLADHHILSHAIGVGAGVHQSDLDPVAYDGQALLNLDAQVVTHLADLAGTVTQSVARPVTGSLLDGVSMGADGFGGVHSVVVDGQVHMADPSLPVMTVYTDLGGTVTVDVRTGDYSYVAPSTFTGFAVEHVGYTVVDQDGDAVSTVLDIAVNHIETVSSTPASETLQGHAGTDVFVWHLADAHWPNPSSMTPVVDTVAGFKLGQASQSGGEVLDLRDLLQGEHAGHGSDAQAHFLLMDNQAIVLNGVDLRAGLGLMADASSGMVINKLLAQGQLHVDA